MSIQPAPTTRPSSITERGGKGNRSVAFVTAATAGVLAWSLLIVLGAPPAGAQVTTATTGAANPGGQAAGGAEAINAGGLVFFGIVAVLVVGTALLYFRNRPRPVSSSGPVDGTPPRP